MKKIVASVFITILLMSNTLSAAKKAILIGVQNYADYAPLSCTHGDVDDMRQLLAMSGYEDEDIMVLKDEKSSDPLTAAKIMRNINDFSRAVKAGDNVLFFFSGHGVGDDKGNNYLLAYDGNRDLPEKFGSLPLVNIKNYLKKNNPEEIVMIIDACRTFEVLKGRNKGQEIKSYFNTGAGIDAQKNLEAKENRKNAQTVIKMIYACAEGQQSFERHEKNNGAFTYYFTYPIETKNSGIKNAINDNDLNNDGIVTIEELTVFAKSRLEEYCRGNNLNEMNPVFSIEGGVMSGHTKLFKFDNSATVNAMQSSAVNKTKDILFSYDESDALSKINSMKLDSNALDDDIPEYTPKYSKTKLEAALNSAASTQDIFSWEEILDRQKEIETQINEEEERAAFHKSKKQYFIKSKQMYSDIINKINKSKSIDEKYSALVKFKNEINSEKRFEDITSKIMMLIEPVFNEVKTAKNKKDAVYREFSNKLSADLSEIEKMLKTDLQKNIKLNFVSAFKDKWSDYKPYIDKVSSELSERYEEVIYYGAEKPKKEIMKQPSKNGVPVKNLQKSQIKKKAKK
ncbi:caspase family protein [Candidatus Dependentiae bacterium]|nr:caspase family protein [Candidatus Dependentiae bacterium]